MTKLDKIFLRRKPTKNSNANFDTIENGINFENTTLDSEKIPDKKNVSRWIELKKNGEEKNG